MNKMLDKLLVLCMLYNVFHVNAGPLHPLMCANSLSTKLMTLMAQTFLHRHSYTFITALLVVDGGGTSKLSMIFQRSFGEQHHLQLELMKVDVLAIEFFHYYKSIALTKSHLITQIQAPSHSICHED